MFGRTWNRRIFVSRAWRGNYLAREVSHPYLVPEKRPFEQGSRRRRKLGSKISVCRSVVVRAGHYLQD